MVPPGHLRSPVSLVQTAVMMSVASLGFISTVVGFYMSYCNDCVMYPGATDLPYYLTFYCYIPTYAVQRGPPKWSLFSNPVLIGRI